MMPQKPLLSLCLLSGLVLACGPDPRNPDAHPSGRSDGGTGVGHIKACLFDNGVLGNCSLDGQPFNVSFGANPISAGTHVIKLISDGTAPVTVSPFTLNGDTEFTVTSGEFGNLPATLNPGQGLLFQASFTAVTGGARIAKVSFTTTDEANSSLVIKLNAIGDDARICACLVSGSNCIRTTEVDFGNVSVGGRQSEVLRLSACGSDPVNFDRVQLVTGSPTFGVTGVPASGTILQPGGSPIELNVSFTPPDFQRETGRVTIFTASRTFHIGLSGNGVSGTCRPRAEPASVDFGSVVADTSKEMEITITNDGIEDCTFPDPARISAGASAGFSVVSPLQQPLAGGESTTLRVRYLPPDLTTPHVGQLVLPYADDQQMPWGNLVIPLTGTPVPVPNCSLVVTPGGKAANQRTVDFGLVRVNSTKVLPITLTNVGNTACSISSTKVATGTLPIPGIPNSNAFKLVSPAISSVAPGATATIELSFTPTVEGNYASPASTGGADPFSVNLIVNTSDTTYNGQECGGLNGGIAAGPGCVAWGLRGQGARIEATVVPPSVDFGTVSVGCGSADQYVIVSNSGTGPLQLKTVWVDPASSPFTAVPGQLPAWLQPGEQRKITIRAHPPSAGPFSATLYIETDSSTGTLFALPLRVQGASTDSRTDTFVQAGSSKADILFVVDNSGSMSEEQGLLAQNAQTFVTTLEQASIDYQIAVVTTDVTAANQRGHFQGSPKIIKPSTSAASQFANTIRALGTSGDATEQGLEAMRLALSDPLINDPQKNGGFLRPDAKLVVIVVSDEEDSSPSSTNLYSQFLLNMKSSSSLVSFSAIVGDTPSGCTSSNGDALAGDRYLSVQQALGGRFQSICSSNWGQMAQALGTDISAARLRFPLSSPAEPTGMTAAVNGSIAANWTWEEATNSVLFSPAFAPPTGASVVVTYSATCF